MKLIPIVTEKTLEDAKNGRYTFKVNPSWNKFEIKEAINRIFGVHVVNVRTINMHGIVKRTLSGRKRVIKPGKKAIVTLKDKEKIDVFETKK